MHRLSTGLAVALLLASAVHAADHVITEPRWIKIPTQDDLQRFWPASARDVSGKAVINCVVTSRGALDSCALASETPSGHGFGAAALLMAPLFVMQPQTVDGVAVSGGEVQIPIIFNNQGGVYGGDSIRVANNIPWRFVPTSQAMAAVFPDEAVGKAASGHVVLRCQIAESGGLKGCQTATEWPRGNGFAIAARKLSQTFRVADFVLASKGWRDIYVDVPFDFRDPHQNTAPVTLTDPEWLQGADPDTVGRLFPKEAARLGLTTGRAVLNCVVAHDGGLTECTVVSEDPVGLGFGASALTIASVMKMNAWTKQGAPVDGARISLPIRLNITDTPTLAPASAKPGQTAAAQQADGAGGDGTYASGPPARSSILAPQLPPPTPQTEPMPARIGARSH